MQELDFNNLTRRADPHRSHCWRIYCGNINAGWIGKVATISAQTEWETGRARCFCGTEITTASLDDHIRSTHREIQCRGG